jgi:hypothetical protein
VTVGHDTSRPRRQGISRLFQMHRSNCTCIIAGQVQRTTAIIFFTLNDPGFIVSDVQLANWLLKNPTSESTSTLGATSVKVFI